MELYHEGTIPLSEFAARPVRRDQKDILVRIIIKKDGRKAAYTSQRNSRTDFPVIACCVYQPWKQMVCVRWGKTCKSKGSDHYRG